MKDTREPTEANHSPLVAGMLAQTLRARSDVPYTGWLVEGPIAVMASGMDEALARETARRWNAHADLIAALEDAAAILEEGALANGQPHYWRALQHAADSAYAALAKAKGGE